MTIMVTHKLKSIIPLRKNQQITDGMSINENV